MVGVELFGTLSLRGGDGMAIHLGGRCARLLAYLALHRGRCVGRAELLENVWAEAGDHAGAGTFNTALWRLRRQLRAAGAEPDALLACDGSGVMFDPRGVADVDAPRFEGLAAGALQMPFDALDDSHLAALRGAVVLHRAELLLDFGDDWVLRERERLRRMQLSAFARLAEHAMRHGRPQEAIVHAQAILDREPLREDVHCLLMRAFVAAGQRALALRQFERCRALLRTELAIAPMGDTLALYREIAEGALPGGSDASPDGNGGPPMASYGLNAGARRNSVQARVAVPALHDGDDTRPARATQGRRHTDAGGSPGAGDRRVQRRAGEAPEVARIALERARRCVGDADRHLREGLAAIAR